MIFACTRGCLGKWVYGVRACFRCTYCSGTRLSLQMLPNPLTGEGSPTFSCLGMNFGGGPRDGYVYVASVSAGLYNNPGSFCRTVVVSLVLCRVVPGYAVSQKNHCWRPSHVPWWKHPLGVLGLVMDPLSGFVDKHWKDSHFITQDHASCDHGLGYTQRGSFLDGVARCLLQGIPHLSPKKHPVWVCLKMGSCREGLKQKTSVASDPNTRPGKPCGKARCSDGLFRPRSSSAEGNGSDALTC